MFETINPATEEILAEYQETPADQIDQIIQKGQQSFKEWRLLSFSQREEHFLALAKQFRNQKESLARLMTLEMGKPITQSLAEIEKCAWVCEYYAQHSESYLKNQNIDTDYGASYLRHDPLGVILAVMPWNFPFWQVCRFAAPTLMAGNTAVLKHAPNVTGCAQAIQNLFHEADFPQGTFQIIVSDTENSPKVVQFAIRNPAVRGVSITGSVRAGKAVAEKAGRYMKPSLMELGGNDPYIVLRDADLNLAAETCVNSRLFNSGQTCISAKRFIVEQAIASEFENLVTEKMTASILGDPLQKETTIGPLAREDLRRNLRSQVNQSLDQGATLCFGGKLPENKGYYYPATLLKNIPDDSPADCDELFGPVASLFVVSSEEEAITLANKTPYGLGAALFTKDIEKAQSLAAKIETGCVAINTKVSSDPRLPFGGVKDSGYGRELGQHGSLAFTNIKTITIA